MSLRFPSWGLAFALGLTLAECGLVLNNLLRGFGAGGVLHLILPVTASYLLIGGALDLLMQRLRPGWGAWGRLGAPALLTATLGLVSGQLLFTMSAVLLIATLWAWLMHRRRLWVLGLLWFVVGLRRTVPDAPVERPNLRETPGSGPNVAVLVMDTVRKDLLSVYGYSRPTSPGLERLAARGLCFDAAYSTGNWSLSAHGSMWTGLLPRDHHADNGHVWMEEERTLLAERLLAAGYDTAGFSANPFAGSGVNMTQGFHSFEDHWREFTVGEVLLGYRLQHAFFATDRDKGGADILAGVRRWLASRETQRPFFLFVNFMEAHGPYQEVPRLARGLFTQASPWMQERAGEAGHMAQLFDIPVPARYSQVNREMQDAATFAAAAYVDELITLLPPDTVIFVMSDHGDLVEEHGQNGHNAGLWEPIIAVPLIVVGPGIPEGLRVQTAASVADLYPTVLGLAGLEVEPGIYGRDLLSLSGARLVQAEHPETVYTTSGWRTRHPLRDPQPNLSARVAVTDGHDKRVLHADGRDWGFDLDLDPGEENPLPGDSLGLPIPDPP